MGKSQRATVTAGCKYGARVSSINNDDITTAVISNNADNGCGI